MQKYFAMLENLKEPAVQTSGHVVSAGLQTGQGESLALPREPPLFHTCTALQGAG